MEAEGEVEGAIAAETEEAAEVALKLSPLTLVTGAPASAQVDCKNAVAVPS